jgi:hypothetical protein
VGDPRCPRCEREISTRGSVRRCACGRTWFADAIVRDAIHAVDPDLDAKELGARSAGGIWLTADELHPADAAPSTPPRWDELLREQRRGHATTVILCALVACVFAAVIATGQHASERAAAAIAAPFALLIAISFAVGNARTRSLADVIRTRPDQVRDVRLLARAQVVEIRLAGGARVTLDAPRDPSLVTELRAHAAAARERARRHALAAELLARLRTAIAT